MPLAGTELRIWEIDQKYGALKERLERMNIFWSARPTSWDDVRNNRNSLLAESDWTQLVDAQASLTEEQKQILIDERQKISNDAKNSGIFLNSPIIRTLPYNPLLFR